MKKKKSLKHIRSGTRSEGQTLLWYNVLASFLFCLPLHPDVRILFRTGHLLSAGGHLATGWHSLNRGLSSNPLSCFDVGETRNIQLWVVNDSGSCETQPFFIQSLCVFLIFCLNYRIYPCTMRTFSPLKELRKLRCVLYLESFVLDSHPSSVCK